MSDHLLVNTRSAYVLSLDGKVLSIYSNIKAAFTHFSEIISEGYAKPLSYSQVVKRIKKDTAYNYSDYNHNVTSIIRYSIFSKSII